MRTTTVVGMILTAAWLTIWTQHGQSATIAPVADGMISFNENKDERYTAYADHWTVMLKNYALDRSYEYRGAMEFPLSSITRQVKSATLTLNIQHVNDFHGEVSVYAYPGNGVISVGGPPVPGDFSAMFQYGPFSEVRYLAAEFELPPMPDWWVSDVFVDVDVLSAVSLGQQEGWAYLGFMLCLPPDGDAGVYYATLETPSEPRVAGIPPFLTYEVIPEPATLFLLAVGGAALVRRRRVVPRTDRP